jgi:hypothetical protein
MRTTICPTKIAMLHASIQLHLQVIGVFWEESGIILASKEWLAADFIELKTGKPCDRYGGREWEYGISRGSKGIHQPEDNKTKHLAVGVLLRKWKEHHKMMTSEKCLSVWGHQKWLLWVFKYSFNKPMVIIIFPKLIWKNL